jgi:exodeoxyribonuclease VII small subunit
MNATTRKQQQACAELEQLVQQLESGQMSLDDTLKAYARGSQLLRYCREQLQAVEQQVQILEGGELKPFADERARDDD